MNSLGRQMTAKSLYMQIRMERQSHAGAFLLMEGGTDYKRFSKFLIADACSVVNCYGKRNVLDTIEIAQNNGDEDCIGFVDADFDRVMPNPPELEDDDVIWSSMHDFDLDVVCTPVLERYLAEVSDEAKFNQYSCCNEFVECLLLALKPLSALRLANERRQLRYRLNGLQHWEFFDGVGIDIDAMIDHVSAGAFNTPEHKAALRSEVQAIIDSELDLRQITNGHDFLAGLGIALRNHIGGRSVPQTSRTEVEMHIRLALAHVDLEETDIPAKIAAWEQRMGRSIWQVGH